MSVKNQFIKITDNCNSVLQSADSKLDSISNFWVYTLVFKALIQIWTIDKALVFLPVSWQAIDTSEVLKQVVYLLGVFPGCLMKCCSVQPGQWALRWLTNANRYPRVRLDFSDNKCLGTCLCSVNNIFHSLHQIGSFCKYKQIHSWNKKVNSVALVAAVTNQLKSLFIVDCLNQSNQPCSAGHLKQEEFGVCPAWRSVWKRFGTLGFLGSGRNVSVLCVVSSVCTVIA